MFHFLIGLVTGLGAMDSTVSPKARALLALELIQASPGITADRLAGKLGVSDRAACRYVSILRESDIPVESLRGPYGGYRVGRGVRLPPLVFSATEALGLVMAVLDGHHDASDPSNPVGSALGKIMRALPEPVAAQAEAVRRTAYRDSGAVPDHQVPGTAQINAVRGCPAAWPLGGSPGGLLVVPRPPLASSSSGGSDPDNNLTLGAWCGAGECGWPGTVLPCRPW
jgi:HTH domain